MVQKLKLEVGDVVNRTYKAVRLLGAGYSGEVWEVRHRCLPASYALKLMHEDDKESEHKTSRFSAEA
jgi:serine/threonine-protein kinase